jgi:hypothetical protein
MEKGETTEPQTALDFLEARAQEDDPNSKLIAGLGFEGMALHAKSPAEAQIFIDKAIEQLRALDASEASKLPYPTQPGLLARAHLNLMPLTIELLVNKKIADIAVVEGAYQAFIRDLARQQRRAYPLFFGPAVKKPALVDRYGELSATFNEMATLGLLLRFQTNELQSSDWMALPAFLEPEGIEKGDPHWHVNVFTQAPKADPEMTYKIYVRTASSSRHAALDDKNTSVILVSSDLALPPERRISPLIIISELGNEKGKRTKLNQRTKKALECIDRRTYGDLKFVK